VQAKKKIVIILFGAAALKIFKISSKLFFFFFGKVFYMLFISKIGSLKLIFYPSKSILLIFVPHLKFLFRPCRGHEAYTKAQYFWS
jgi:hypothetical protein